MRNINANKVLIPPGLSGASFELIHGNKNVLLRKSLSANSTKLKQQFDWFVNYQHLNYIPNVFNWSVNNEIASYDMFYYEDYIKLSELSKENIENCILVLKSILLNLKNDIHSQVIFTRPDLKKFVTIKCIEKILYCEELICGQSGFEYLYSEFVYINKIKYSNVKLIISKILSNESMYNAIEQRESCVIHGDLTAENILINKDLSYILLDCNQGNVLSNVCVEIAKLMQSFHSGFEYFETASVQVDQDQSINYQLSYPKEFSVCSDFLFDYIIKNYKIQKWEIVFHEAIHYSRILPYMLKTKPNLFPLVYAKLVELLNLSYELYEN